MNVLFKGSKSNNFFSFSLGGGAGGRGLVLMIFFYK